MKKFIKVLSLILAFTCAFSLFSCKKKKDKNVVELAVLKAGFGETPYRELAKAYMAKNPDVQVKLRFDPEINATVGNQIDSNNNLPEIYSTRDLNQIKSFAADGKILKLNDLLNTTFGEGYAESGKKVKDNINKYAIDACSFDGSTYCIPEYTSINGFVYNKTLFKKFGWNVPTTTKELEALCKKIIQDTDGAVAPITHCGGDAGGYYYFAVDNWVTLYAGVSNLDKFYAYDDPEQFNPESVIAQGKKFANENLYKFFRDLKDGGYAMDDDITAMAEQAQAALISGEAAMMLNGSWFENEMREVLDDVSSVNVAPILNDVVRGPEDLELGMFRLPDMSDAGGNPLRAVGYTTEGDKPVINASYGAYYFIPAKADNVELAVDFLKFLSSDEASVIYTKYTNAPRPIDYNLDVNTPDYANITSFGRDVVDIAHSCYVYTPFTNNPIAIDGKLALYPRGDYWCKEVLQGSNVDNLILLDYNRVKDNWDSWQKEYFG